MRFMSWARLEPIDSWTDRTMHNEVNNVCFSIIFLIRQSSLAPHETYHHIHTTAIILHCISSCLTVLLLYCVYFINCYYLCYIIGPVLCNTCFNSIVCLMFFYVLCLKKRFPCVFIYSVDAI